ncbi:MAG: Vitamin transporter BtuB precursor [Verrucomicrobiota bacterium]|jgi:vitamin B12 transporter
MEPSGPATPSAGWLTAEELARRQVTSLSEALRQVTGVPAVTSGAAGMITSVFTRGANSNQTLLLVDGLRLNDPNTDYAVFLGGACLGACDSLEVSHGPQSTLYGGEAVGGLISLRAARGQGKPTGRLAVEAGSYGTFQGALNAQGARGADAWNLSLRGGRTQNERANNAFISHNAVLRLDRTVRPGIEATATLRWFRGAYGSPGDRFTNDPDNREQEENLLATAQLQFIHGPWQTRVLAGGQNRRFVAISPFPTPRPTAETRVTNRRGMLDAQGTFRGWSGHLLLGGATFEANHTRNTGFGNINRRQRLAAVFLHDEFRPRPDLLVGMGVRNDDFDTFGRATTGRATASWAPAGSSLRWGAGLGTSFRSPSFLDLFGQSAFYRGNPLLRPERARGWEFGGEWRGEGGRWSIGLTRFELGLRDLIASTRDFRSVENILRARTRGWEVTWRLRWGETAAITGHYAYLEAENLTAGTRLLRRPRHRGGLDLWRTWGHGFSAGAGLSALGQREDVHARTFRTIDGEDYVVVRLYAEQRLAPGWSVRARLENALAERYEEVHGYPAIGRGVFLALERGF